MKKSNYLGTVLVVVRYQQSNNRERGNVSERNQGNSALPTQIGQWRQWREFIRCTGMYRTSFWCPPLFLRFPSSLTPVEPMSVGVASNDNLQWRLPIIDQLRKREMQDRGISPFSTSQKLTACLRLGHCSEAGHSRPAEEICCC